MTNASKLRAALLGSGAILALAAGPAFASETDDLKAQIDALQSRLDQLEKQQATTETKPAIAPADAVVGGDYPGSFKLPGSDTSYSIHGFTKLDLIMDVDGNIPLSQSNFFVAGLNPDNQPAGNQGFRTNFFAHQSRVNFESRTPTDYGPLLTLISGDFQGQLGGTDSVLPDNKGGFRIREAWGQLGPIRAGNDNELVTDFPAVVEHVTFFDPNGPATVRRITQIEYIQSYGKFNFQAAIAQPSVEQPSINVSNNVAQFAQTQGAVSPANTAFVTNQQVEVPSFWGAVGYYDKWGHIRVSGKLRQLRLDNGLGGNVGGTHAEVDQLGYMGFFSGHLALGYFLPALGKDFLGWIANWATGDVNSQTGFDDSGSLTVLNFGTPTQRAFTNPSWGVGVGVEHWWTDSLRSSFRYGLSRAHLSQDLGSANISGTNPAQVTYTGTYLINLLWSPVKQVTFGLEYIYGEVDHLAPPSGGRAGYTGRGTDNRIQVGLQYLF